jgi:hypothetical protein
MSADNGWVIMPHPKGGYALVMYFASSEGPVVVKEDEPSYPTVEAAFTEYYPKQNTKYWSEYGLHVNVPRNIHHDHNADCIHTKCTYCGCCEYCEGCACEGTPGCARTGCGCADL